MSNLIVPPDHLFPTGDGVMQASIRSVDWPETPMGKPDQWPASLRTTLAILLASPSPTLLFWGPQFIQFYNDAYQTTINQSATEPIALGKPAADSWAKNRIERREILNYIRTTGQATYQENQAVPTQRNGHNELTYWRFFFSVVPDETSQTAGILLVGQETTRQPVTPPVLSVQEEQLQFAIDSAGLGIWDLNPVTGKVTGNDRMRAWFNLPVRGEVDLALAMEAILEKDRARVAQAIAASLQPEANGYYDITYTLVTPRETLERIIRAKGKVFFNENHEPIRFTGTLQDITNETHLREEQRTLIDLVESSHDYVAVMDIDGRLTYLNAAGRELVGAPADVRLSHLPPDVLYTPEQFRFFIHRIRPSLLQTSRWTGSFSLRHLTSGEEIPCHAEFIRISDSVTGAPLSIGVNLHDLRSEQAIQQALIDTNAELTDSIRQFTFVTDFMPQMVWATQPSGQHDFFNQRWYDFTGLTPGESFGEEWANALHPDDVERTNRIWTESLTTGKPYEIEYRMLRYDGQYRWLLGRALPMRDEMGQIVRWFGTCTDIHDQKAFSAELEERVADRTQELKAANYDLKRSNDNLQRFAYVASHDLQEPLRKIQSFGDILQQTYSAQLGDGGELLERMQAAAHRMSTLIRDLLAFSRITTERGQFASVSLGEVLNGVLLDLELAIQESGTVIDLGPMPTIRGDIPQLSQLFQNLISNAIKFRKTNDPLPHRISIQADLIDAADLPPAVKPVFPAHQYHRIAVADTGIGFDEKYLDRIFEVFQRLHGRNQYAGTGIGLAIVQKVVDNHGGAVSATSQPGQGATFTVYFPV
ncbi:sensor histidine kinase [Spirosoma sp. KUDC1026]|uniref:sensor histidine kinase n=1 Tax=Spirosoma sp. KUDC1026 TaxID=2745947 RepID=UPI00159BA9A9|nr:PAS domain-containing protein [Spirosoma sp. KUDC1026]QKZ14140.1 PAS domain-containing protein [Spirosoma sp. KUDC1026]